MKLQKLYLTVCVLLSLSLIAPQVKGQYHIASHSIPTYVDSIEGATCSGTNLTVHITTNAYAASLSVITYFGDNTAVSTPIYNGGGFGYANMANYYSFPGTYTIKTVLYDGSIPVDSVRFSTEYLFCNTFAIKAFFNSLGTCVYDSTKDPIVIAPLQYEVDSNGIIIDTITTAGGFYNHVYGNPGDIYTYKVVNTPPDVSLTCPSSGIIYDTIQPIANDYKVKHLGVICSGITGFDLGVNTSIICGRHHCAGTILVGNLSCIPEDATLTMHFSPKYNFTSASPAPSSSSGTTVTWDIAALSLVKGTGVINFSLDHPGTFLIVGDTVNTNYRITPYAGDLDTFNNAEILVDTVTGSYDPNFMNVLPQGIVAAGTQLKYAIEFENTGNDTAFNIYVMDTLSDNVDPRSLKVLSASAPMNMIIQNIGGHNIAKFDFPNINLLDSAHHDQCTGVMFFTINTKSGLSNGTTVFNHAGIFFDDNPAVLTDTVENIISSTASVPAIKANITTVQLYPNPVNDMLTIKTTGSLYNILSISNSMGETIITQQMNGSLVDVNVKSLPAGLYYIMLKGDDGMKMEKFVKE